MKVCWLISVMLCGAGLSAQNLVVNPGFEECFIPDSSNGFQIEIAQARNFTGWKDPNDATCDLFYIADSTKQMYGRPKPLEGRCYCGFIARADRCEYPGGQLTSSLKKGVTYSVSFALTTESNTDFSERRIGINFSTHRLSHEGDDAMGTTPQITLDTIQDRKISGDWIMYTTFYTASGGEKYFTFGQFKDMRYFVNPGPAGYFYLDDVYIGAPREEEPVIAEVEETSITKDTTVPADNPNLIAPGKTLVANNIYFESGKSRILPESYTPLYDIILEMKLQPNLKVEIVGHTDSHGDKASNQKLSEERAKAVADFFISKGIDASRITTRGAGSSQPVGDDDQKNRRVEFIFSE